MTHKVGGYTAKVPLRVADALLDKGYIKREGDRNEGRRDLYQITDAGINSLLPKSQHMTGVQQHICSHLNRGSIISVMGTCLPEYESTTTYSKKTYTTRIPRATFESMLTKGFIQVCGQDGVKSMYELSKKGREALLARMAKNA